LQIKPADFNPIGQIMKMHQINLTTDELKLLFKHVYIGNWVLTATKTTFDEKHDKFMDKMIDIMVKHKLKDGLIFDEKLKKYFLSMDKEAEYWPDIEDYDNDTFWDNLTGYLAERDAEDKYGIEELNSMDHFDRVKLIVDEEEKYNEEFSQNGIQNLIVKKAKQP